MDYVNKIICGDSAVVLKDIPENSIDLVVTSPPYDDLRDYKGFVLDMHTIGEEIYRVLKPGGICAMVIQDSTKNFGKTLTSFRTILDWCDNIGFKLFECCIYHKNGTEGAWWKNRFRVDHEYMPIFLKGERPQYFNKEPLKVPSKHGGKVMSGFASRKTDGTTAPSVRKMINPMKCRGTVSTPQRSLIRYLTTLSSASARKMVLSWTRLLDVVPPLLWRKNSVENT